MKTNGYDRQASFTSLCAHYRKAPIVLYVGAGISVSRDPTYGLPDWVGLLNKLANKITGDSPPTCRRTRGTLRIASWNCAWNT